MLTSKLINPTPFQVELNWDKGIVIQIPPDSEVELTMQQMDDFRPGKPGTEEVKHLLDYYGLFLLDGDRSWEEQAVGSLEVSLKTKQSQLDGFINRIRDARIAQGSPVDDETLAALAARAGYDTLQNQCTTLKKRVDYLRSLLSEVGSKGKVKHTLDPKRTCFLLKPPKQFASEVALKLFLMDQTPEFRKQHETMIKGMLAEDKKVEKKDEKAVA